MDMQLAYMNTKHPEFVKHAQAARNNVQQNQIAISNDTNAFADNASHNSFSFQNQTLENNTTSASSLTESETASISTVNRTVPETTTRQLTTTEEEDCRVISN